MNEWLSLFPVRTGFSLSVMVLGMVIVFLGLIILIGTIILISKIIKRMESKNSGAQEASDAEPSFNVAAEPKSSTDAQLIAVITAALMAMDGSGKRLVVRSVRRTSNWSDAGRREQLDY